MAFVVVLHLSPEHASQLEAVLRAVTPLTVSTPQGPVPVERDHVYVIAPNTMLTMNDSYLSVSDLPRRRGPHSTIDLFFRTLGIVHRQRAFAVVLSGNGSDASVGITRIKEEGGITFAQSPLEAEFDSMPRNAMATGAVDWVLPVAQIPAKLVELWANARTIELPIKPGADDEADARAAATVQAEKALHDILVLLRARTGHDFRSYKRATVLRRIERRMQVHALPNLHTYCSFLQEQPEEAPALLKDLLIGVTNFFRDGEAFAMLQRDVLPEVLEQAGKAGTGLRAWVPGCSTGEEAYSIAMQLCEQLATVSKAPKIHIFATDIDEAAIGVARMGAYPEGIDTDVTPERLRRFFDKEGHQYRIRTEVREKVMFAVHNILRDPPFSKLDLICCRNLLIYLDRDVHAEILEMFHFALRPGGYLFLGSSESAETSSDLFGIVDKKNRIYRANVVTRTPRYVPVLPMGATGSGTGMTANPEARGEKHPIDYAELHGRLAEQYAPPSVLIDANGNIVHLSDRAGRYLRHGAGAPSHQLLNLVDPELRLELRTAIYQATHSGKSVEARRVKTHVEDGRSRVLTMIVRPVPESDMGGPFVMILFDEIDDSMVCETTGSDADRHDHVVVHLEEELRRAKEQLQGTIEQSETSNEELKASNEELQAINEELRSTTEELETSKEELQSINEELITVNLELKSKVDETAKINDDLKNLIASSEIATVFVDRAMNIKRYTPHAARLFNLISSDVGRSLLDITHRLDYPALADDAAESFQSLRVIEREVSCADGRWYLARILPYRTTEDRIDGAVLTFVDVTSRHRAEERLRLVAESTTNYAIVTFDPDGRIVTWTPGAAQIFGYSLAEAVGQPMRLLFSPEDVAAGQPELEMETARSAGRFEDSRWLRRKDGGTVFCSGVTTPLHEGGKLTGFGKIARDLTEQKRLEAEREAHLASEAAGRAEALAANELKDEFLAVMSHELKNPLNLIQLHAALLQRNPEVRDLPAVARAANTIHKAVLSQVQIIDDLLDLSRVHTGKLSLHRVPVDFTATVQTIADDAKEEALARQLVLCAHLPEEPVMLDADPVRVEQVVWNLLSNALKFTPSGGHVELRLERDGADAVLRVRDDGEGIVAEDLPNVFDMYDQGGSRPKRRQSGLGIGLALVRSLVESHGGSVSVESDGAGMGACFTVRWPLATPAASRPAQADDIPRPHLNGRRALVVDEDSQTTDALRELLELEGMTVYTAVNWADGLTTARDATLDFVIQGMPTTELDGAAFLADLRELPGGRALPVIAATGMGRPADTERVLAAGFAAHLMKPITLDKLLSVVHDVLTE